MPGHYGPTDYNALRRRLAAVREHSRAPLWMFPVGRDVVRPEEPAEEIRSAKWRKQPTRLAYVTSK